MPFREKAKKQKNTAAGQHTHTHTTAHLSQEATFCISPRRWQPDVQRALSPGLDNFLHGYQDFSPISTGTCLWFCSAVGCVSLAALLLLGLETAPIFFNAMETSSGQNRAGCSWSKAMTTSGKFLPSLAHRGCRQATGPAPRRTCPSKRGGRVSGYTQTACQRSRACVFEKRSRATKDAAMVGRTNLFASSALVGNTTAAAPSPSAASAEGQDPPTPHGSASLVSRCLPVEPRGTNGSFGSWLLSISLLLGRCTVSPWDRRVGACHHAGSK